MKHSAFAPTAVRRLATQTLFLCSLAAGPGVAVALAGAAAAGEPGQPPKVAIEEATATATTVESLGEDVFIVRAIASTPVAAGFKVVEGRFLGETRGGGCPQEPPLQNYMVVPNYTTVPGFAAHEEAGAILRAPTAHYPIDIIRIGIGWSSFGGGNPDSLEEALRIYPAGLPNPGAPQYEIEGPVLVDGAFNEFNLVGAPGEGSRRVTGGPFIVSLKLSNASTLFGPAPIHDGVGCIPDKSAIYAFPQGQWSDNCSLGVGGQWVIYAIYKRVNCTCPADLNSDGMVGAGDLAILLGTWGLTGPANLDGVGVVSASDMALLLGSWGPCL